MARPKLPDFRRLAPPPAPQPAPTRAGVVRVLLSRREFLRAIGVGLASLATLPLVRAERAWAATRGRFFTAQERRTLAALVDDLFPPDHDPGAAALGVVRYIERLLAAYSYPVPRLYAGGPFSGRQPFIDYERGVPGRRRPRNDFRRFIPPSRLQDLYWRAELYGSARVPEVAALDAQFGGPLRGLRDVYRTGLRDLDNLALAERGRRFVALSPAERTAVRERAQATFPPDPRRDGKNFIGLVVQHLVEGAFATPEYGGNDRGRGWTLLRLEGDSQPLGYALYSRADDAYRERPDFPLSTPNPDEIDAPLPLGAEAQALQRTIATTTSALGDGC